MGLFGRKSKDDKLQAELDQAKKEAEAAKKAIKDLLDQNVESKQVKAAAEKKAQEAEKKLAEMESKLKELTAEKEREKKAADRVEMAEARQIAMEERKAKLESAKKPTLITTHKVQPDETLSHIALKYYKHATPPYWKFLLEHNNEVLKGNERNVRAGMELEIPELPEDLKD